MAYDQADRGNEDRLGGRRMALHEPVQQGRSPVGQFLPVAVDAGDRHGGELAGVLVVVHADDGHFFRNGQLCDFAGVHQRVRTVVALGHDAKRLGQAAQSVGKPREQLAPSVPPGDRVPVQAGVAESGVLHRSREPGFPAANIGVVRTLVEGQVAETAFDQVPGRHLPHPDVVQQDARGGDAFDVGRQGDDRHLHLAQVTDQIAPVGKRQREDSVPAPVVRRRAVVGHAGIENPVGFPGKAHHPKVHAVLVVGQRHQHALLARGHEARAGTRRTRHGRLLQPVVPAMPFTQKRRLILRIITLFV